MEVELKILDARAGAGPEAWKLGSGSQSPSL